MRWQAAIAVVGHETQVGHLVEAEQLAESTMTAGARAGVVEALAVYGAHLHDIRLEQGRREEIAQLFIDAAADNPTITSLRTVAIALCVEIGDLEEARRRYDAEVQTGFAYAQSTQWFSAMEGAVEGALALDDHDGVATLYERLLPYADRGVCSTATPTRPVARMLGCLATRLGRFDEAEEHFVMGVEYGERLRAVYWTARTLLDHADLCVARGAPGDDERARDFATRARAIAENLSNAALVARAEAIVAPA